MSAPLAGVRVLDLTHFVAGPWCTMLLADLGAEIIKLEPPEGEIGRSMGGVYASGESAIFLGFNRGKRAISLDLKQPEGLKAALELVEQVDIVVQNFRPGTAERLGIGATELRDKFPRLIYCTVSAFGPKGPYATRPANDPVVQALSGAMAATGKSDGPPVRMGVSLPDFAGGGLAAISILAALHHRERQGEGATVELNLLDAQMYAQTDLIAEAPRPAPADTTIPGTSPGDSEVTASVSAADVDQSQEGRSTTSIRGVYTCGDGRFLWLDNDELGSEWLDAIAAHFTGEAPRAEPQTSMRASVRPSQIAALLRTQSRDHWLNLPSSEGAAMVPVLDLADVLPSSGSQTLEVDHPTIGALRQLRTPVTSDPPWPDVAAAPPLLGEHTREILQELGFSGPDIDRMAAQGIAHEGNSVPQAGTTRHVKERHKEDPS